MPRFERSVGLLVVFAVALVIASWMNHSVTANTPETSRGDGVLLHVTTATSSPHRLSMGLHMASIMKETHPVLVYFDIEAVQAVVTDGPALTHPRFGSAAEAVAGLAASGVRLRVCPSCLEAAGKTPEDLVPGVQLADKDEFLGFASGRILTLDY